MTDGVLIVGKGNIDGSLGGFEGRSVKAIDGAVQRGAEVLRDRTKTLPPVSARRTGYEAKGIPVDKGQLRQSIQKRDLARFAAGVGPLVKHGVLVHEGTDRMPPRPYFDWALEMGAEKEIDAIVEKAVSSLF